MTTFKRWDPHHLVGRYVRRKRDGAVGEVVEVRTSGRSTLVTVRLDSATLHEQAGGEMVGGLSWLRSYFTLLPTHAPKL
jgi:hypothetical protein